MSERVFHVDRTVSEESECLFILKPMLPSEKYHVEKVEGRCVLANFSF